MLVSMVGQASFQTAGRNGPSTMDRSYRLVVGGGGISGALAEPVDSALLTTPFHLLTNHFRSEICCAQPQYELLRRGRKENTEQTEITEQTEKSLAFELPFVPLFPSVPYSLPNRHR
jgi:hypothetical protein